MPAIEAKKLVPGDRIEISLDPADEGLKIHSVTFEADGMVVCDLGPEGLLEYEAEYKVPIKERSTNGS